MKDTAKSTHIQTMRQALEEPALYIQQMVGMDQLAHKEFIYQQGLSFLRTLFDEQNEWFRCYERDAKFWKWFRLEWGYHEMDLAKFCLLHSRPLTAILYFTEAEIFLHESKLEVSFQNNYLKIIRNVNISRTKKNLGL